MDALDAGEAVARKRPTLGPKKSTMLLAGPAAELTGEADPEGRQVPTAVAVRTAKKAVVIRPVHYAFSLYSDASRQLGTEIGKAVQCGLWWPCRVRFLRIRFLIRYSYIAGFRFGIACDRKVKSY